MFDEPSVRPGNALVFVDVQDFGADSLQGSTAFVAQAATRFDALQVLLNLTYEIASRVDPENESCPVAI